MTPQERAVKIAADLLSEGWDDETILHIAGAAFCCSLLNLPAHLRMRCVVQHVAYMADAILQMEDLAPHGISR